MAQKIQAITSDFRPGFVMPVFDMKKFDFSKKIVFNLNRNTPNSNDESVN